jgi:hypothetical protein
MEYLPKHFSSGTLDKSVTHERGLICRYVGAYRSRKEARKEVEKYDNDNYV